VRIIYLAIALFPHPSENLGTIRKKTENLTGSLGPPVRLGPQNFALMEISMVSNDAKNWGALD